MLYQDKQALQSPSQLAPESRLNQSVRGPIRRNTLAPVNNGLLGYWSLDGSTVSGASATDLSGNANNGTLVGSPPIVIGRIGQGLSFNGSTQYMQPINPTNLSLSGDSTISAWVFLTAVASDQAIWAGNWDGISGTRQLLFLASSQSLNWATQGGSIAFGNTANILTANVWFHAAMVKNGSNISVYFNGLSQSLTNSTSDTVLNSITSDVYVGGDPKEGDKFMNGTIDDVRVWNRALSPVEIQQVYADTTGNLGMIAPVRKTTGAVSAPSSTPYFPTFLGGGGMIAARALKMLRTNNRPTRREFLTLSGMSDDKTAGGLAE